MTAPTTVRLTRRQAAAVLNAELSAGYGTRRPTDLVEAERRLKAAVRAGLDEATGGAQ